MARKEPYLTKGTKKTLDQIQKRLEHVFCLLSLQVMLCLLSDELVLSEVPSTVRDCPHNTTRTPRTPHTAHIAHIAHNELTMSCARRSDRA